jgi:hypothetical protein
MSMARGGFVEASDSGYGARAALSIAAAADAQGACLPAGRRRTNGWRRTSSKARTRQTLFHTPLPRFLEVLILRDFKSLFPEVLILHDFKSLSPEVLILVGLKWRVISGMQNLDGILEVLILEDLGICVKVLIVWSLV